MSGLKRLNSFHPSIPLSTEVKTGNVRFYTIEKIEEQSVETLSS